MRLIDLDTLKQNLCGDCTMNFPKECRQIGCAKVDKQDILEALRTPIIDAVQVVRCKDCIYYYPAEYDKKGNTCLMLREMINAPLWVKEDDYCSKGVSADNGKERTV